MPNAARMMQYIIEADLGDRVWPLRLSLPFETFYKQYVSALTVLLSRRSRPMYADLVFRLHDQLHGSFMMDELRPRNIGTALDEE